MFSVENRWPHYRDSVKVEWNLGKRCNLDCTYCPAEIHDNFSSHKDLSTLYKTVDTLAEIENVRISFTGGEPCVHPQFEELVNYARPKINWLSVTTNITRKPEYYQNLNVNYLVLSLHFEDKQWCERVETIRILAGTLGGGKHPKDYHVMIMAHHDYMDEVKLATRILIEHNIPFSLRRIRWTERHDWFDDMRYNLDDLEWIKSVQTTAKANTLVDSKDLVHTNDLLKNKLNMFKGWQCKAGVESLMINWDGEVHRATCRVGGSLGNIYNGTFERPEVAVICSRDWCTCAADVNITKWK